KDADVDRGLQEMHCAVCEHGVGTAGVEAVDLEDVGAVDGARSRSHRPVGRRAPKSDPILEASPGAAWDHLIGARLARLPEPRPAGIFGEQDSVRGAVRDVRETRAGGIGRQDAPRVSGRQGWIDPQGVRIVPASAPGPEECERPRSRVPVLLRRRGTLKKLQVRGADGIVLRMEVRHVPAVEVVEWPLLYVREDKRPPSVDERERGRAIRPFIDESRWKSAVAVVVAVQSQTELLEVVDTLNPIGGLADSLYRRHQETDQDGDDRDNDQQLDQRHAAPQFDCWRWNHG